MQCWRPYKEKFSHGERSGLSTRQIDIVIYHSGRYKSAIKQENFTLFFSGKKKSRNGSNLNYVKVQDQCQLVTLHTVTASLNVTSLHLVQVMVLHQDQLLSLKEHSVIGHIHRVEASNKIIALPLDCITFRKKLPRHFVIWARE